MTRSHVGVTVFHVRRMMAHALRERMSSLRSWGVKCVARTRICLLVRFILFMWLWLYVKEVFQIIWFKS